MKAKFISHIERAKMAEFQALAHEGNKNGGLAGKIGKHQALTAGLNLGGSSAEADVAL